MRCKRLIAGVLMLLATSACVSYRVVRVKAASAKNPYHAASPASLSEYLRMVLRTSEDNAAAQVMTPERLQKEKPELAALAQRAAANPGDLDARHLLAEAYCDAQLFDDALALYQEMLQKSPGDVKAEIGAAMILHRNGFYPWARMHAEQAIKNDPDNVQALDLLARICLRQRDTDSAARAYQAALRRAPENADILANTGYVHILQSDWQEARELLEHALKNDFSIVEAHNHLGIALAQLGDREGALTQFAFANPPAAALNDLGVVYLAQDRLEEAGAEFRRALALDPGYAKAWANLQATEARIPPPAVYTLKPIPAPVQVPSAPLADPVAADASNLRHEHLQFVSGNNPALEALVQDVLEAPRAGNADQDAHMARNAKSNGTGNPHSAAEPSLASKGKTGTTSSIMRADAEARPASGYAIQVYAGRTEEAANTERDSLAKSNLAPLVSKVDLQEKGIWYRVRLYGYNSHKAALSTAKSLLNQGLIRDYWVSLEPNAK